MAGFAKADTKIGFGQVEPNHLSGIVEGKIYAQYPADTTEMGKILEQGRFAKYDGSKNQVNLSGASAWMMIYNEEKLPDERKQNHKDFALNTADYTYGEITPRLIKIEVGDIFTTNTIDMAGDMDADAVNALTDSTETAIPFSTIAIGSKMYIGDNGYLSPTKGSVPEEFEVIKPFARTVANLPDLQPAVKLMRIK